VVPEEARQKQNVAGFELALERAGVSEGRKAGQVGGEGVGHAEIVHRVTDTIRKERQGRRGRGAGEVSGG
jgi:hypothetical protein